MSVRFTRQEYDERKRAQAILDNPSICGEDAKTQNWHVGRAKGILRSTQEAAEKRAEDRESRSAVVQPKPPNGVAPQVWTEQRERVRNFLKAVAEGRVSNHAPQTSKPVVVAPDTAPQATVEPPADTTVCPSCLVERAICSCSRTPPNIVAIGDTLDRIAARLPKPESCA